MNEIQYDNIFWMEFDLLIYFWVKFDFMRCFWVKLDLTIFFWLKFNLIMFLSEIRFYDIFEWNSIWRYVFWRYALWNKYNQIDFHSYIKIRFEDNFQELNSIWFYIFEWNTMGKLEPKIWVWVFQFLYRYYNCSNLNVYKKN